MLNRVEYQLNCLYFMSESVLCTQRLIHSSTRFKPNVAVVTEVDIWAELGLLYASFFRRISLI